MNGCKLLLSAWMAVAALSATAAPKDSEIYFADPTIFVDNGKYYMTGTRANDSSQGFSMLESTDLKTWRPSNGGRLILEKGHSTFGDTGFWAPQVYKEGGEYYLAYTANEQTVLAKSSSVTGPYTQDVVGPIDGSEKNIDPFIFKDGDKYYLYHVRFNRGNYLWVAEFDLRNGKIDPSTLRKCFSNTERWEKTDPGIWDPIMEGPTVLKMDGKYYMFYSANHFENKDYAVGYAYADSPTGPWIKSTHNPIIHRTIVGENGSGHGDLFIGLDGKPYYIYHIHYDDKTVSPRRTRIVPLIIKHDKKTGLCDIAVDRRHVIVPQVVK